LFESPMLPASNKVIEDSTIEHLLNCRQSDNSILVILRNHPAKRYQTVIKKPLFRVDIR
jgi:hypothetical protein